MFHHINVKIIYVIYLQGCEIQYIRKPSNPFKVILTTKKKMLPGKTLDQYQTISTLGSRFSKTSKTYFSKTAQSKNMGK